MQNKPITSPPTESTPRQSGRKCVGTALLFLAVYFFIQFAVTIPYALMAAVRSMLAESIGSVAALAERVAQAVTEKSVLLTGVIDMVSLGAFALVQKLLHRPVLRSTGFRRVPVARLLPLIPLGLALNVFFSALLSLLPASVLASYTEASNQVLAGGSDALLFLLVALLAPITEEVLFRGLVYGNLRKALPRPLAVAVSAIVFGLMHGQPLWMLYTALLGAFFCIVFDRYESLFASILLHMSFNAGSFLVLIMQSTPVGAALVLSGAVAAACVVLIFRYSASEEDAGVDD